MNKTLLCCLGLFSALLLSACQSVDDFLTDSGMRQHSQQDIVVNPVPRARIPEARTRSLSSQTGQTSTLPAAPTAVNKPATETQATPTPNPGNTPGMVPNVAPAFGE